MKETEKIGNVTLNLQYYSGTDEYSDGDIEDRMLEIVSSHPESEFPLIITRECSWPILYHLSPLRENIISWVPFRKGQKVLELGSGCGAVTGASGAAGFSCGFS